MVPLSVRERNLLFLGTPSLWPQWPWLPLVRRRAPDLLDLGLLYDFRGTSGRYGYSSTVFRTHLFLVPEREEELLALPREVFDSAEELYQAGWAID